MGLSLKDIYNNALQLVSKSRVTTVDDGTYEANLCNDIFPRVLDNTLYEHSWNSCIKRISLTQKSETPAHGYTYCYQLPNDCVRVIQAYYDSETWSFDFQWEIQGRTLLTDETLVWLKYVARPTNYEQLNPPMIECLVYALAISLAIPLKMEFSDKMALVQEYEQKVLPRAKSLDSMESRYLEFEENPWIEALHQYSPRL